MDILRTIGGKDILVDVHEPCSLSFEESILPESHRGEPVELSKKAILKHLASDDDFRPLTLHWELLDYCNLECPFCYIVGHSFRKIVRFAEIRHHLASLIDEGLLFATLTGGESLIHPDFIHIFRFLKERGVVVEVFSNGMAISDEHIALFRELPPSAIEISVYSMDDERMAEYFGARVSEPAQRILRNILKLQASGVQVICKSFVNTLTDPEINAVKSWCEQRGIKHYSSSEMNLAYDGADLRRYEVPRSKTPRVTKDSLTSAICMPCGTKNYGSAIDSAFAIYPCPSIRLPDCRYSLRELGVAEALARMKSFIRKHQDQAIGGVCKPGNECASCLAYAIPVRNDDGQITHFVQPTGLAG